MLKESFFNYFPSFVFFNSNEAKTDTAKMFSSAQNLNGLKNDYKLAETWKENKNKRTELKTLKTF